MEKNILLLSAVTALPFLLASAAARRGKRKYPLFLLLGVVSSFLSRLLCACLQPLSGESGLVFDTGWGALLSELFKTLPLLFYGVFVSNRRQEAVGLGFCLGAGFGLLAVNFDFLLFPSGGGFGVVLLRSLCLLASHSITAALIGLGVSLVRKRRKLFITGTLTFLTTAVLYNATVTLFLRSAFPVFAYFLVFLTVAVLAYFNQESLVARSRSLLRIDLKEKSLEILHKIIKK